MNHNDEPEIFKKGTVLYRDVCEPSKTTAICIASADLLKYGVLDGSLDTNFNPQTQKAMSEAKLNRLKKRASKTEVLTGYVDIIKDTFWKDRPLLLLG